MNDDRRRRAFLRCNFVFVGPAAVICHRFPFEHFVVEF